MNKLTFTTAIIFTLTTAGAYAHHPAAEVVDAEIYSMIDENVADTPHADMVLDDMGSAMDQAVGEQGSPQMDMAGAMVDIDVAMDSANTVDTIDLMENVVNTLAE